MPSQRQRKKFEKSLKKWLEQVKFDFFKNLIHKFQLIEIDRGSQKILNAISIDRKTDWINRNSGKTEFLKKNNLVFEKTPQSIEYKE